MSVGVSDEWKRSRESCRFGIYFFVAHAAGNTYQTLVSISLGSGMSSTHGKGPRKHNAPGTGDRERGALRILMRSLTSAQHGAHGRDERVGWVCIARRSTGERDALVVNLRCVAPTCPRLISRM
jgi:hypothetical protein